MARSILKRSGPETRASISCRRRLSPFIKFLSSPHPGGVEGHTLYEPLPITEDLLVFFHGGGFVVNGSGYDLPLRRLAAATGCAVLAPEVRLAPEHPYPAAHNDALAIANWAATDLLRALGSRRFGIGGDSSGGNLAVSAVRKLRSQEVSIDYLLLITPMLDATASSRSYDLYDASYGFSRQKALWYFDQLLPQSVDRKNPDLSPLFARDLGKLPPTFLAYAECDPLRDEARHLGNLMREQGSSPEVRQYAGMIHGFFQMDGRLDAAQRLPVDISHWLTNIRARQ